MRLSFAPFLFVAIATKKTLAAVDSCLRIRNDDVAKKIPHYVVDAIVGTLEIPIRGLGRYFSKRQIKGKKHTTFRITTNCACVLTMALTGHAPLEMEADPWECANSIPEDHSKAGVIIVRNKDGSTAEVKSIVWATQKKSDVAIYPGGRVEMATHIRGSLWRKGKRLPRRWAEFTRDSITERHPHKLIKHVLLLKLSTITAPPKEAPQPIETRPEGISMKSLTAEAKPEAEGAKAAFVDPSDKSLLSASSLYSDDDD